MGGANSLKIFILVGSFCQKHMRFQLKNLQKVISHVLKSDPNFEEKLTFCMKNDMKNSGNLNTSNKKSENLHFDVLLLLKVCNV